MRSPCDPPKFDEQDWSKFDFSRWNLEGVSLDETSAAIAQAVAGLFQSEEWNQSVKTTLPEATRQVLQGYREEVKQLGKLRAETEKEFDERIAAADKRSALTRTAVDNSAAPPDLQADTTTFRLGVKILSATAGVGVPGVTVRMMNPRDPEKVLVDTVTDHDGNVVASLAPEDAKEFDGTHARLQVLSPSGKTLQDLPASVCIRMSGTETKVLKLEDSPEIEEQKKAAVNARVNRDVRAEMVRSRVELLKKERTRTLGEIDCRIRSAEALIREIEKPAPTPPTQRPNSETAAGGEQAVETPAEKPPAKRRPPPKKARPKK